MNEKVFKYRWRKLVILADGVRYSSPFGAYSVHKPEAFRFTYEHIEFDWWSLGPKVRLQLKGDGDSKINLIFRAYFGIGKNRMLVTFNKILEEIWLDFFEQKYLGYESLISRGEEVTVERFRIGEKSISKIDRKGEVVREIDFTNAVLIRTGEKLVINSTIDRQIHIDVSDRWDWNSYIVKQLIENSCPSST